MSARFLLRCDSRSFLRISAGAQSQSGRILTRWFLRYQEAFSIALQTDASPAVGGRREMQIGASSPTAPGLASVHPNFPPLHSTDTRTSSWPNLTSVNPTSCLSDKRPRPTMYGSKQAAVYFSAKCDGRNCRGNRRKRNTRRPVQLSHVLPYLFKNELFLGATNGWSPPPLPPAAFIHVS